MFDEEKRNKYKKDLEIDFSILEHNWANHSVLYMDWGELHAESVAKRDRKKEELDLKQSYLDSAIRSNPEEYGIVTKLTEAGVTATIKTQDDYKVLIQELIDSNEEVAVLTCAKTAFEHRKKALEGITQLYCAGYFAKPNIPTKAQEDLGGGMRKAQQKAFEDDNGRLKKRKKIVER